MEWIISQFFSLTLSFVIVCVFFWLVEKVVDKIYLEMSLRKDVG